MSEILVSITWRQSRDIRNSSLDHMISDKGHSHVKSGIQDATRDVRDPEPLDVQGASCVVLVGGRSSEDP